MTQKMIYALKERIGDPLLFCGRKQQMDLLLSWTEMIPKEMAKSRVLLGRRKSGKTAIMQRLFNVLWNQNGKVIPFYLEVLDEDQWLLDFADVYYRTFVSQYLSFKTRTVLDIDNQPWDFEQLTQMALSISDNKALRNMDTFQKYLATEQVGQAKSWAFGTPSRFAGFANASFLIMIDEIQYMTQYIYHDKAHQVLARRLPGAYHGLVESKVAPMLVSGSYVGWMVQLMREMFTGGRLKRTPISSKLTVSEGMEAVYRYAEYNGKVVSDEAAFIINLITQGDPFYIASLFRSDWEEQDFLSVEGAIKTLAYEIRNHDGELFGTWSEYIYSTLKTVNDQYAKQILLFLSKQRHKECTRIEISNSIGNALSERQLEEKLRALEYGDLITKRSLSNFRYSGIPDNILDLIFRDLYQEDIYQTKPDIEKELTTTVNNALKKENQSLKGIIRELRGQMLELIVYRELNQCRQKGQPIKNVQQRLRPFSSPQLADILTAASAKPFSKVWKNYYFQLPQATAVEVDVLAEDFADNQYWAIVFEIKNRDKKHLPTIDDAQLFMTKIEILKQTVELTGKIIALICPIYLSAQGFSAPVETWLHEHGILTTDMARWDQFD